MKHIVCLMIYFADILLLLLQWYMELGGGATASVIGLVALSWVPVLGPFIGGLVGGMVGYTVGSMLSEIYITQATKF